MLADSRCCYADVVTRDGAQPCDSHDIAGAQDLAKRGATLVEGDATAASDLHRAFKVCNRAC